MHSFNDRQVMYEDTQLCTRISIEVCVEVREGAKELEQDELRLAELCKRICEGQDTSETSRYTTC